MFIRRRTFSLFSVPDPNFFQDCNSTAEVVFILDSSSSVGQDNFQQMRLFTQNVTTQLKSEYEHLNVSVITFSDNAQVYALHF